MIGRMHVQPGRFARRIAPPSSCSSPGRTGYTDRAAHFRSSSMHSFQALRVQAVIALLLASCASSSRYPSPEKTDRYEELVAPVADWRELQKPNAERPVPDYN